ncbi:MAG TPA: phage holin family protein [Patescibacteria group bacterium]|nr:phage holin family protein [Patescibacteria group bacterium]
MSIIISLLVNGVAVFAAGYILPGVHIADFVTAIIVAIILGVINTFIKPILTILTLPLTIITLGLFSLVINAVIILIVAAIVPGFKVDGFLWAVVFSIVLSIISGFLNMLV